MALFPLGQISHIFPPQAGVPLNAILYVEAYNTSNGDEKFLNFAALELEMDARYWSYNIHIIQYFSTLKKQNFLTLISKQYTTKQSI